MIEIQRLSRKGEHFELRAGLTGVRSAGRALGENPLQRPAVHVEAPGGLGNVSAAELVDALDVLPPHPVRRHRVLGRSCALARLGLEGRLDLVGICGLRQVVERTELNRRDGRGDVAVAGQDDAAGLWPALLQARNDVEAVAVAEAHVDHGIGRRLLLDRRDALGDAFGNPDLEAAGLHGAREAGRERAIVVDKKKRVLGESHHGHVALVQGNLGVSHFTILDRGFWFLLYANAHRIR